MPTPEAMLILPEQAQLSSELSPGLLSYFKKLTQRALNIVGGKDLDSLKEEDFNQLNTQDQKELIDLLTKIRGTLN